MSGNNGKCESGTGDIKGKWRNELQGRMTYFLKLHQDISEVKNGTILRWGSNLREEKVPEKVEILKKKMNDRLFGKNEREKMATSAIETVVSTSP